MALGGSYTANNPSVGPEGFASQANARAQAGQSALPSKAGAAEPGILSQIMGGAQNVGQTIGENPNLQMLLTSMGQQMDPQGAGGVIGRAGQGFIQRKAQQDYMKNLVNMLGKGGQVKTNADGSSELKVGESQGGGDIGSESDLANMEMEEDDGMLDSLLDSVIEDDSTTIDNPQKTGAPGAPKAE